MTAPALVRTRWTDGSFQPGTGLPVITPTGINITDQPTLTAVLTAAGQSGVELLIGPVGAGVATAPAPADGQVLAWSATLGIYVPVNPSAGGAAIVGALNYRGLYDASVNTFPATGGSGAAGAVVKGNLWVCSVAGTLGGKAVTPGDLIIATVDTPSQTAGNWDLVEHDLGYAPEDSANKSTDGTMAANSATLYPSQSAAKTYADGKVENAVTAGHATVAPSGAAVSGALVNQRLAVQYGVDPTTGLPNRPWQAEPLVGAQLWATAKFSANVNGAFPGNTNNTSTLTPSLTGSAGASASTTRIAMGATGNETAGRWRITATVNVTARTTGNLRLRIRPVDNAGAVMSYLDEFGVTLSSFAEPIATQAALSNYRFVYEVDVASLAAAGSTAYLDVALISDAGSTDGSIALSNVSVQRVQALTGFARVAWDRATGGSSSGGVLYIDCPLGSDPSGNLLLSRIAFGVDGPGLEFIGNTITYQSQYGNARFAYANLAGQWPQQAQAINNCDVIWGVYKADGVTTELRGNTHGGETGASGTFTTDYQVFLDYGDGNGWTGPYVAQWANEPWRRCLRVKIVANTVMTRSDQGSPFCSLTKTYYIYRDGTIRFDRTVTFLQDQKIDACFWHMMSLSPGIQATNFRGKIGQGLTTKANFDGVNTYLAAPALTAAPTVATTGGSIPANLDPNSKYSVRVTALDAYGGESAPSINYSLTHIGTAGSTITPSWSAVTGAVAYAVYFGIAGFERRIATTASTTYTILGSETPTGPIPLRTSAPTGTGTATASSGLAEWSIYFDPQTQTALSMAIDRAATLALPGVAGVRVDLQRQGGGLFKNYWRLIFSGNDLPTVVANGTVFAGTLWMFSYIPADPVAFERDQAPRASSAAQLSATLYPST